MCAAALGFVWEVCLGVQEQGIWFIKHRIWLLFGVLSKRPIYGLSGGSQAEKSWTLASSLECPYPGWVFGEEKARDAVIR